MIGGFLGAGKTTLISQLARKFQADGKHVCIVTNDQAAGLVDTELLRSEGLEVNEVAGSCFCCNFNGLTDAMAEFETRQRPDVVLAEPVGSCTDLVATIALPMMQRMGEQFSHSPYAVVLKPSHALRILASGQAGFSPKAEYIFRKQLEESEIVLINRIDELEADQVQTLKDHINEQYPGRTIICLSARTGENMDQLYQALHATAAPRSSLMEVDYDVYAEGEAELGWLNATATFTAPEKLALDDLAMNALEVIRDELAKLDAEPAHLKILCSSARSVSVANLVSSDTEPMLSLASDSSASEVKMVVNARVCLAPESLRPLVEEALAKIAKPLGATLQIEQIEAFRPGRPVPTHRVTSV